LKTNNAGSYRREKTIEKTILRILGSCTFSHSLDPERTCRRPRLMSAHRGEADSTRPVALDLLLTDGVEKVARDHRRIVIPSA
jgi:hypothetical protein